jgi:phage repressor protein C with HTH and peptisase S24 domain
MASPTGTLGSRIKEAREAEGLSQAALARHVGTSRASVSQWESDATEPTGTNLVKIARFVKRSEAWLAEGRPEGMRGKHVVPLSRGGTPFPENLMLVPEIDVSAGMGPGRIQEMEVYGSDMVRDHWVLPNDFIRELRAQPEDLRIIPLEGDSMAPTLLSTDRAVVNVGDRIPSPPGIFCLWDGHGVVMKRVEIIPKSKPLRLRIISDNTLHEPYEIEAEEFTIIGRLKAFVRRL